MKATIAASVALAGFLPLVNAHGAIYGDHVFGSAFGGISSNPLNFGTSFKDWFFRNLNPSSAKSTIDLNPGGSVTLAVACSQDSANQGIMCNDGGGSLHLRPQDGKGSGCGLSISYKSFDSIQPNDLNIFSVRHDCPKNNQARLSFQVPDNLPAGEATCAFHWVPPREASADEQYMTGFKCRVTGSNKGSLASSNQKPLYWAANGIQLASERPHYLQLPDGAQRLTVSGGSSSSGSGSSGSTRPVNPKKGSSGTGNSKKTVTGKKCSAKKRQLKMLKRQLYEAQRMLEELSR